MEEQTYITEPQLQLPPQLSTYAHEVDWVYDFIFVLSVISFVAIVAAMVYFMWRYRARPGHKAEPTGHSDILEIAWTFGPVPLLFLMFHWGFQAYLAGAIAPDDAINVRVRASQWSWDFEHPNGIAETNIVHIPAGVPVRFVLSSSDVLHSFFVPDFRIKRDAVPGMFTSIWVQAIERDDVTPMVPAEFGEDPGLATPAARREWYRAQLFCTEYCGANTAGSWDLNGGHATMLGQVVVQRREDYDDFMANPPPPRCGDHDCTPLEWGEQIFSARCTVCHSRVAGGPTAQAPNLWGVFGREERLVGRGTITIDEAYVRHSIQQPAADVVEGFNPIMPTLPLSEQQIDALVAYLQTLHD